MKVQVRGSAVRKGRSLWPPEVIKNLDVVEERMPLGFVVFGIKELKQPWALMQLWGLLACLISKVKAGADSSELLC